MRFLILISVILCFSSLSSYAQDEKQKEKSPFDLKGGLRVFGQYYDSNSEDDFRTSPSSFGIAGNLSMSIGKFTLPISLAYRDNSLSLNRPFFYLGASPKLGPVQFHLGNRNLNFSQYTLGGASFFGVGAELKAGKFRFGAMAGSFQNPFAQRDSIVYGAVEIPTFDRKGYSVKLGVGGDKSFFDLIFLKVKDEYLTEFDITENNINPKDNLVIGTVYQQSFGPRIRLKIDAAVSALTNDLSYDFLEIDEEAVVKYRDLFEVNPTTNISYAGDAELQFTIKKFKSSLLYRRIYPHYVSLGSTYITPDKEEYLAKFSGGFAKNRVRMNLSLGWQKNNLINERSFTSNRFIGSLMLLVAPKGPFKTTVMFNNYDISNTPTIIEDNDSLKVVRVMNQFKVAPSYRIKGDDLAHNISASFTYKVINGQFLQDRRDTKNRFANIGYGLTYKPWLVNARVNLNYNQSNNYTFVRDRYGVTMTVSKPFFDKKVNVSLNNSYFRNLVNDKIDGSTYRTALTSSYAIQKKHRFNLTLNYILRNSIVFQNRRDVQLRTSYAYVF